jgi:hypothetical protein
VRAEVRSTLVLRREPPSTRKGAQTNPARLSVRLTPPIAKTHCQDAPLLSEQRLNNGKRPGQFARRLRPPSDTRCHPHPRTVGVLIDRSALEKWLDTSAWFSHFNAVRHLRIRYCN